MSTLPHLCIRENSIELEYVSGYEILFCNKRKQSKSNKMKGFQDLRFKHAFFIILTRFVGFPHKTGLADTYPR